MFDGSVMRARKKHVRLADKLYRLYPAMKKHIHDDIQYKLQDKTTIEERDNFIIATEMLWLELI